MKRVKQMEIKNYLAATPRRKLHAMVSPRRAMQEPTAAPWDSRSPGAQGEV